MIDCLFYEGSTVLYRICLACWSRCEEQLLNCSSSNQVIEIIEKSMKSESDSSALLKSAWKFKVKHEYLVELYFTVVAEGVLEDIPEYDMEIMHLPTIKHESNIATLFQWEHLWEWIPQRYRLFELNQIFSSEEDGFNLKTLTHKCNNFMPTVLLIKTSKQKVKERK